MKCLPHFLKYDLWSQIKICYFNFGLLSNDIFRSKNHFNHCWQCLAVIDGVIISNMTRYQTILMIFRSLLLLEMRCISINFHQLQCLLSLRSSQGHIFSLFQPFPPVFSIKAGPLLHTFLQKEKKTEPKEVPILPECCSLWPKLMSNLGIKNPGFKTKS